MLLEPPEKIVTGAFSLTLPTGDESRGLGGEQTNLGGLVFSIRPIGTGILGSILNMPPLYQGPRSVNLKLPQHCLFLYLGTGEGIAPARPNHSLVLTLLLEMASEFVLTGSESGENPITLVPGLHFGIRNQTGMSRWGRLSIYA